MQETMSEGWGGDISSNKKLYLIGSLRNKTIPELANRLRKEMPEVEIFDDWYSAGFEADDHWKTYEQAKGNTYSQALRGHAAKHVFEFDKHHLDTSSHVLLVLPAGKSGHMEIMYAEYGAHKNTAILIDPEDCRWDVMYQFIPTHLYNDEEILSWLKQTQMESLQDLPAASLTQVSPKLFKASSGTSRTQSKKSPASPSSERGSIFGTDGGPYPTVSEDTLKQMSGMYSVDRKGNLILTRSSCT